MVQDSTGFVHFFAAVVALLAGAAIFFRRKGTRSHRIIGYLYATAMLTVLATALLIYRLTHSFNILHFFAVAATPPLLLGLTAAIAHRPGWLERHYRWMSWSYVGLFAAFAAETATRVIVPYCRDHFGITSRAFFWELVLVMTGIVTVIGYCLIRRNQRLTGTMAPRRSAP
jgi:uncharacterized membrane protein